VQTQLTKFSLHDVWGGLAAMLVALPSAIAFGVTVYAAFGSAHLAEGALAGILGAIALGLVAPALGGTQRLISAPCAPAAAVLAAFAIEFARQGGGFEAGLLMLALLGLIAGLLQIVFGAVRLGRLIEYMPFPVVSGYLSGVGLYIVASQTPKFLGAPKQMHFWQAVSTPELWQWQGMLVGAATIAAMLAAPRLVRAVPAVIVGLLAGLAVYFGLGLFDPALLTLAGNPFVIGPVGGGALGEAFAARWQGVQTLDPGLLSSLLVPALTLAVLLSIDTLKTCVVLDALTRSRHDSNRELIGQGCANVASAMVGGLPGAGTMGATLVNMSSGGQSRFSGIAEGVFALFALLALGTLIAWIPVAALSGILIVIGLRMLDLNSLHYLKSRSTLLDFMVIAAVVAVALQVSLIAASGVGILLAVLLFMREQIGGNVVRRKLTGSQVFSKRERVQEERDLLLREGERSVIVELQGSLFFGTANQLYKALEPELQQRDFVILDLRRVQTLDVTAAHMLDLIQGMLAEHGGLLLLSQLPRKLPSGQNIQHYFDQVGLVRPEVAIKLFDELDAALEWVEERIIEQAGLVADVEQPLQLHELELFHGRKPETLASLESQMEQRHYRAGERIFANGDAGDELYMIRRGAVRILLHIDDEQQRHLGTFGRGAFFGEMAFLDGLPRSADAVASVDTDLFVLSRKTFDRLADEHRKFAINLMEGLASVLSARLRFTNCELRALEN
jgi:SulP family sulfate permease